MSRSKGPVEGKLKVLTPQQVEAIHGAALRVLSQVGIELGDQGLRKLLISKGAKAAGRRVYIPEPVVQGALEMAPGEFALYGRGDAPTLDLGPENVYLGTGGAALWILDPETDQIREATLRDLADLAWLVDNLEHIHFFLRPVIAHDVPGELLDVNTLYACLANTQKHVMVAASSPEDVDHLVAMAAQVAGGEEELLGKPFISFVCSWMVSPLRVDVGVAQVLRRVVEWGLPVALSSAPVTGSTAPASLSGLLVQVHAEELSGIVLAQAIREGAPVLYGPVPGAANFRTMGYVGGAVEAGLMNAAAAQLSRHIGVPIYSDAGLTEAKAPDIQAAYEKAANVMLVALAGGNFIHHAAGMLDSMLAVAPEQYVIDDDILGMALRALSGIRVDEEALAVEVIERVGPGGHFLTQPHTLKFARSGEFFLPKTADRGSRADWEKAGKPDTRGKAREIAREILSRPRPQLIPEEIDSEIREEFRILLPRT